MWYIYPHLWFQRLSEEKCQLLGAWASQNPAFHLLRTPFPGNTVIDALDNQLNPTLKQTGPVIQQYFEAWWRSLRSQRRKMAFWFSEQNLTAAKRMHLPNVFPSVCLRWNEACSRGLPPNNWLLQSTAQYCSFENWPMGKTSMTQWMQSSDRRCSNNDLLDCSEAGTSRTPVPTRKVGAETWKQLIGLLKAFSFVEEIFSQPLLCRQCRKHQKKYAGGETSWQLI